MHDLTLKLKRRFSMYTLGFSSVIFRSYAEIFFKDRKNEVNSVRNIDY